MGTYVIGDVHGCYSQFMELLARIEKRDSDARFILTGDIIKRGPQDAQMLAWAYENITLDGKFQMVLGNHDDDFIETFGRGEFETVYSLSRIVGFNYSPREGEFSHLEDQPELMYKYAKFLASQPLYKKLEINNKKYIIAHAWYPENLVYNDFQQDRIIYFKRFDSLWYRDRLGYNEGGFEAEYEPIEDEILIHGHSPTLTYKEQMSRIYSPGKIWRRKNSINVDCGLVFNVIGHREPFAKFGNLAAYHIEADEALYLWEIVDEYALNDEEYYEDRMERKKNEREESERKRAEAWENAKTPYLESFYRQILALDETPDKKEYEHNVNFNFLDYYISEVSTFNDDRKRDDYDFDFKNLPIIAVHGTRGINWVKTLYAYNKSYGKWTVGMELQRDFTYQAFSYEGIDYLFGTNGYEGIEAKGVLYNLSIDGIEEVVKFKTETSTFDWRKKEDILKFDKYYEDGKPTGVMIWDFYHGDELCIVKIARNLTDAYYAHVLNSKGEVLSKISHVYYGIG